MNIYELRQAIKVEVYYQALTECTISYKKHGTSNIITLDNDTMAKELIAIGSIEETDSQKLIEHSLSQWDALNIAIRFELAREMDKEIDNSDIGKAIKKITDEQGDSY